MYQVAKRDGQIADFALSKISVAIERAFQAQDREYNQDIIDLLALKVTAAFEPKVRDSLIGVEDIQGSSFPKIIMKPTQLLFAYKLQRVFPPLRYLYS